MRRLATITLCATLAAWSTGCNMMGTMQGMVSNATQALRPTSFDGWDPGSETGDPWVQQAGAEARGNRPVEREVDPLGFRNLFMSAKARDIEKNLGIE